MIRQYKSHSLAGQEIIAANMVGILMRGKWKVLMIDLMHSTDKL